MTIEILKGNSIKLETGMVVCLPEAGKETREYRLKVEDLDKFEKTWNFNGGVLCYVTEGESFVTPSTPEAQEFLSSNDFKWTPNLWVPFSTNEFPKAQGVEWWHMRHNS